ncbi:hypothetical protein [Rhizobium sp. Leaf383]|uniref:hypothetical protein n=1 Tax=Rhizobium sp. Leaf383 TaxID=1736357 RepID=UPI000713B0B5|nr:hypothetical protein [Rhizobium sp. Leaf383]KQS84346.1 hypothetical protein ASG58_21485 [Rhizobium sp. Leaf383]
MTSAPDAFWFVQADAKGEITDYGNVYSVDELLLQEEGTGRPVYACEELPNMQGFYVSGTEVLIRPTFDIEPAIDLTVGESLTLDGLPDRVTLTMDGETIELTGGELTLEPDMPAVYSLTFEAFPFMPCTTKVTVHAA